MRARLAHPTARRVVLLLCVMLISFPKGGVRLGVLPLTWGYLLLFLSVPFLLPYRTLIARPRYLPRQMVALLSLVPFCLVFFYSLLGWGFRSSFERSGAISTGICLIFLPILFLWFYPPMLPLVDREHLLKCVRYCMLGAALFGIFLFFWRPLTNINIHIPYLTTNGDDLGDPTLTSNNSRGFFFKLISTYNNGNLYGAATLILLRLFDYATPRRWERWVVRVALLLTLSRTIWAGLIFNELLTLGAVLVEQRRSFPRLRLGRAAQITLVLALFTPIFILGRQFIQTTQDNFLLDPTLGGRTAQFQHLGEISFFPTFPSGFIFTEIVYLSAINLFGYVGFVAITILLLAPLGIVLMDRRALHDPVRRAAFKGLVLYAMISTSDGALNNIPVIAFYWFAYMLFLFGLPGSAPAASEAERVHTAPSFRLVAPLST